MPGAATWSFCLASTLFSAAGLHAQVTTYTYHGNNFTTAQPPYTTSDSVSGTFTTPSPLAANLYDYGLGGAGLMGWAFADGVNTWNNTNSSFGGSFNTDQGGNITAWYITATANLPSTFITICGNSFNPPICGLVYDIAEEEVPPSYVVVYATNSNNPGTWSVSPPPLAITTSHLPTAKSGAPYTATLMAAGGSGVGYTWSLSSGSSLPVGFTLSPSGVLSSTGSPAAPGNLYRFTVQVADSANHMAMQALALEIPTPQAITYVYKGNHFTSAAFPYTTSDSVTGTITLSSPVPANQNLSEIPLDNILNWSFSDGVNSYDVTNSLTISAWFGTDSEGNVDSWSVTVTAAVPGTVIATCAPSSACPSSSSDYGLQEYPIGNEVTGGNTNDAGTWSIYIAPVGYSITDLGTLGGPSSEAWALNSANQVVGVSTTPTSGCSLTAGDCGHAVLWSKGTMTDLGTLGGAWSKAQGINDKGQIVGTVAVPSAERAFLYSGGVMTMLGTFGGPVSVAKGINDNGQVAGFAYISTSVPGGYEHAFLYSGGIMTDLGTLGGAQSAASGINSSAQVVGGSQITGNVSSGSFFPGHAFLYSGGTMSDLGTLGGTSSSASGINRSGQVAGTSQLTGDSSSNWSLAHAFLYSSGVMTDAGTVGGVQSQAYGINDGGQVVGISTTAASGCSINASGDPDGSCGHAFLYTAGVVTDLSSLAPPSSGWVLVVATAINNNGAIAGYGTLNGNLHAFLMTSQIATTASGLAYSRVTQTFNGTIALKNTGSSVIDGPLEILFTGLTPGVTLANASGALSGTPYLTVPASSSLGPGQSVTVSVQFKDPSDAPINFIPAVYSRSVI